MRRTLAILLLLAAALPLAASDMSYIFKRGDRQYIVTGNLSVHNIGSMTRRWSGDYLWANLDGREYLIRDDATMTEARKAFAQVEANQVEYHAIEAKMRPIEKKHDELERSADKLSDRLGDDDDLTASERRQMETRLRELEQQMKPLEAQLRELEREEERFDEKQEKLEEVAEARLEEIIRRAIRQGVAERVD
jgi:septal ring factor EnvC (AmiA/AmiB activator)